MIQQLIIGFLTIKIIQSIYFIPGIQEYLQFSSTEKQYEASQFVNTSEIQNYFLIASPINLQKNETIIIEIINTLFKKQIIGQETQLLSQLSQQDLNQLICFNQNIAQCLIKYKIYGSFNNDTIASLYLTIQVSDINDQFYPQQLNDDQTISLALNRNLSYDHKIKIMQYKFYGQFSNKMTKLLQIMYNFSQMQAYIKANIFVDKPQIQDVSQWEYPLLSEQDQTLIQNQQIPELQKYGYILQSQSLQQIIIDHNKCSNRLACWITVSVFVLQKNQLNEGPLIIILKSDFQDISSQEQKEIIGRVNNQNFNQFNFYSLRSTINITNMLFTATGCYNQTTNQGNCLMQISKLNSNELNYFSTIDFYQKLIFQILEGQTIYLTVAGLTKNQQTPYSISYLKNENAIQQINNNQKLSFLIESSQLFIFNKSNQSLNALNISVYSINQLNASIYISQCSEFLKNCITPNDHSYQYLITLQNQNQITQNLSKQLCVSCQLLFYFLLNENINKQLLQISFQITEYKIEENQQTDIDNKNEGLSTGTIVGIVIGSLALVCIVVAGYFYLKRRQQILNRNESEVTLVDM